MRQHIINGSNIHGFTASNSSVVAIVAAHDAGKLGMRTGKRLSKLMAPVVMSPVVVRPSVQPEVDAVRSRREREGLCTANAMTLRQTATTAAYQAWPAAAFEPPAAAWARLVIGRAISV
ncbi:hypothetical protein [Planctomicrobium piriforme]|uniref:Uncharacterized protein n=1 Tax=Planctomicrobium piriforme TaxID=1576369 RepID=A0A1I3BIV3_9PLAN|nr:hypothetical protein [Planctomicrobium piriforme]SFH62264.1 hypothetical protein SAMN05421753_101482 [Planctomicrobium piriforme]